MDDDLTKNICMTEVRKAWRGSEGFVGDWSSSEGVRRGSKGNLITIDTSFAMPYTVSGSRSYVLEP